jgi:hypothetical protein
MTRSGSCGRSRGTRSSSPRRPPWLGAGCAGRRAAHAPAMLDRTASAIRASRSSAAICAGAAGGTVARCVASPTSSPSRLISPSKSNTASSNPSGHAPDSQCRSKGFLVMRFAWRVI